MQGELENKELDNLVFLILFFLTRLFRQKHIYLVPSFMLEENRGSEHNTVLIIGSYLLNVLVDIKAVSRELVK